MNSPLVTAAVGTSGTVPARVVHRERAASPIAATAATMTASPAASQPAAHRITALGGVARHDVRLPGQAAATTTSCVFLAPTRDVPPLEARCRAAL